MGVSKVIYGGNTIIDLTADTVTADKILKDYTAHGADGEPITGSCSYDADTQDATASDSEILSGETAYVRGVKLTGKMKNNGAVAGIISNKDDEYGVLQGYHDGSGKVRIDDVERAKIIGSNIRQGVTILGVTGTMSTTEGETRQEKTVTPSTVDQVVLPDDGYTCLTSVTVKAIPYVENDNSAGGKTVTIG